MAQRTKCLRGVRTEFKHPESKEKLYGPVIPTLGEVGASTEMLSSVSFWPAHVFPHMYPAMCPNTFTHTRNGGTW